MHPASTLHPRLAALAFVTLGVALGVWLAPRFVLPATAAASKAPPRWRHKCERPFSFEDLQKVIEAREDQNWEMITVAPVVMTGEEAGTSTYLRYVACFRRLSVD